MTPTAVSTPFALPLMSTIMIAPTATRVEPTARSMPPEMITKVMPKATTPTGALLRRMLIQFLPQLANHVPKSG